MRAPVLALALLAAPTAFAAEGGAKAPSGPAARPAPGPAPSKQGRELSRALVPQKTWDGLLDRSAEGLSSAVSRSLTAKGEKVPGDLQATIRQELGKSLKYEEAVDAQAQALQKRFSPGELEQATRFYQSPVGKKVLDELPAAQGEVGDRLQERLATVVPDILHKVAPSALGGGGPGAGASPAEPEAPSPPSGTGSGAEASPQGGRPGAEPDAKGPPRKL